MPRSLRTCATTAATGYLIAGAGLADVLGAAAEAAFEAGLNGDVGQHARLQPIAQPEQRRDDIHGDLAQARQQQRARVHPAIRRHEERKQERAAELRVAGPQRAFLAGFERVHVHQPRHGAVEDDVERRGVLQDVAARQRRFQRAQRHQRRVAEHREAPLVAVGHQRQLRLADDVLADVGGGEARVLALDDGDGDKQALAARGRRAGPNCAPREGWQAPRARPCGRWRRRGGRAGRTGRGTTPDQTRS